ncbi:MAG: c-type cytochrome [Acidobacteriota bacterium]
MTEDRKKELTAQERHYEPIRLNRIFAWSSIALAVVILWSVVDDYSRDWKNYQRRFHADEVARLKDDIGKTSAEIDAKKKADLEGRLASARTKSAAASGRIDEIDAQLAAMANDLYVADQNQRFTKALLDTAKWEYDEAAHHDPATADDERAAMEELQARFDAYTDENKRLIGIADALKRERRELTAKVDTLQSEIADLDAGVTKLRKTLSTLDRPVVNAVLNAPMLDFINPTLKIKQTVTTGIENEMNFLQVPRVDRCETCHVAMTRAELAAAEQPFRAHRNLDLIGSSRSPHQFDQVGCTICHLGRDRGTSFYAAAHTPNTEEDRERWERDLGWERMDHWENPMLASRYVESGCLQCHMQDVFVPGAKKLSRGRELFEKLGCHGCHKVAGWKELRNVGPPLRTIATKTSRDWVRHWLADPRGFRPTTKMPRFWFLSNSSDTEDVIRNNVEIDGVVEYLFSHSEAGKYPDLPRRGDAQRGKTLVENVGCHGCHSAIGPQEAHEGADRRPHGPNLMRIGAKTYPGWLYQWIRNPKNYWPDTVMPNLRLTEEEAADVTAYLASLDDTDWEDDYQPYFNVKPDDMDRVRDEMITGYLMRTKTRDEARAQVATMSAEEKKLMVGQKSIARYGCFGCHDIPGFEGAQRIGVELTKEGSKFVDRLDFGFVDIPAERQDWFFQKLKEPRIFDQGKVKAPKDRLKMPFFDLSDEEAESLVTLLMGLRSEEVDPSRRKIYDGRAEAIQAGWRLVRTYNCTGCHLIEGQGGDIRPWIQTVKARDGVGSSEALAFAPPDLHTEGAKVQSDWLFGFLKNVSPIRPWLDIRMPTFQFDDQEVNTLTRFFAALEDAPYPFVDYGAGFHLSSSHAKAATTLVSKDYFNCLSCHQVGDRKPTSPPDSWAPDLELARQRLRVDWIRRWLVDPQTVMPGTRMPSFFLDENSGPPDILDGDEGAQMDLLARWVMSLGDKNPGRPAPLYRSPAPVPLERAASGEASSAGAGASR